MDAVDRPSGGRPVARRAARHSRRAAAQRRPGCHRPGAEGVLRMNKVMSADGTPIVYDRAGQGPAVILVDGALCSRAQGPMPELAKQLASQFTVYNYDRRGRGDSGDAEAY